MIREVLRMGDPRLLREVAAGRRASTRRSCMSCCTTCATPWRTSNGAGLAAPQIGVGLRVVIFGVDSEPALSGRRGSARHGAHQSRARRRSSDEMEEGWEGCLSVPGMRGWVPRWQQLRYSGLRRARASRFERTVEGFHARVVQHECDHLDGILYPMRIRDLTQVRLQRGAVSRRRSCLLEE